jgi:TM2 domain-containing membrane protein YozV
MDDTSTPGPGFAAPPPPPPPAPAAYPAAPIQPYFIERKSPFLAAMLSFFIPGLGHLYVGAFQRALQVFGGMAVSIFITAVIGGPGALLIVFTWFFGIVDSVRLAQAINRGNVVEPFRALEDRMKSDGTVGLTFGVILVGLGLLWWVDKTFNIDWYFMHRWGGPVAFILLGVILIASHVGKKRKEHADGVGMPPRSS